MAAVRNILFIMCDQLRADHLSCYGHAALSTPSIDRLAKRGVRFERAFVQSGVCGPSRMSFYTGRYVASHGATWNRVPLSVGELTLGDHLRGRGLTLALAGKTHVVPDTHGLARFQLEGDSELGALMREGGFVPLDRYDGHGPPGKESGYADFLRWQRYACADPWSDYVISVRKPDGTVASGWQMRNVRYPARVKEEHSETAYMTDRAAHFIREQGKQPWVLHLSYVKPHWPYVAPAPYHAMFSKKDCSPPLRDRSEFHDPHPVYAAYREHEESVNFSRDEVIDTVKPVYMGLIRQIDDHLGRLWQLFDELDLWNDTLIVFTSDHGDYLGDHWLGEKELFYDSILRVPFLLYDPDPAADATRGTAEERFVEAVDAVPTFLQALGIESPRHWIEGRSLLTLTRAGAATRGESPSWRDCVFSELDYSFRKARHVLGRKPRECRGWMVRTDDWKYIHWQGYRPQLFDLWADAHEFHDLGADPRTETIRSALHEKLFDWLSGRNRRTTISDEEVEARTDAHKRHGIFFGVW